MAQMWPTPQETKKQALVRPIGAGPAADATWSDARSVPLTLTVTGANRHDSIAFKSTLDAIPAVSGLDGRPRKCPDKLHADEGHDCRHCRADLRRQGITARIA